ncbi:MAG TPA: fluoride efflux transporter CrcB [Acidimicrobiales bacterium]|nr:fluoride efflux transporter CrcB [Acidimicrobiales bacterium]
MSFAAWLAMLAGGAVGAPSRYLLDSYIHTNTEGEFPWGTLAINAIGSLLLGILTGLALEHGLSPTTKVVLGTGFCGAFTTFSTFSFETVRLAEEGATNAACRNIAANVVLGTVLAGVGLAVTLR